MSTSYVAIAAIGLKVKESIFYKHLFERNCKCKIDGMFKFCPECGKRFTLEVRHPIEGFDECDLLYKGLKVIIVTNYGSNSGEYIVTALGEQASTDKLLAGVEINHELLEESKRKIKEAMIPIDAWKEENYKLWVTIGIY